MFSVAKAIKLEIVDEYYLEFINERLDNKDIGIEVMMLLKDFKEGLKEKLK